MSRAWKLVPRNIDRSTQCSECVWRVEIELYCTGRSKYYRVRIISQFKFAFEVIKNRTGTFRKVGHILGFLALQKQCNTCSRAQSENKSMGHWTTDLFSSANRYTYFVEYGWCPVFMVNYWTPMWSGKHLAGPNSVPLIYFLGRYLFKWLWSLIRFFLPKFSSDFNRKLCTFRLRNTRSVNVF